MNRWKVGKFKKNLKIFLKPVMQSPIKYNVVEVIAKPLASALTS